MNLLHIDSSILGLNSVSRTLTADIVAAELHRLPDLEVRYRDLATKPVGHLSASHLVAAQGAVPETPDLQKDIDEGQRILDEFLAADRLGIEEELRSRSVAGIVDSIETLEGGGFVVRRPFPQPAISEFDPFLLLDEMGPVDLAPGEAKGAPDHPHRGFETVTYIISGEMEHKDSHGHAGKLRSGDVQWMTAGSGVVHAEMPSENFQRRGGTMHGFQLWVNLPQKNKMMKPRYQEIPSANIPQATTGDGLVSVRVIAGESLGARAVIDTVTPIMYLHFTLKPGGRVVHGVTREYNAFAYVIDGEGEFGGDGERAKDGQMVKFAADGDEATIVNPADAGADLEVLLLAGIPLNEAIVRYGPFVMNTKAEIYKAIEDYQSGRMGEIDF